MSNERKEQDFATNKLLIVFTMVFVGIFATMYMFRMANASADGYLAVLKIVNVIYYISFVGTIASAAKFYFTKKKDTDNPYKLITARHLMCIFVVIFACATFAKAQTILMAVKYIYILLTAVAVQYFMLVTYTKDIYLMAFTNIVNLVIVYLIGTSMSNKLILAAVSLAILAATAVLVKKIQKNNGKLQEYVIFKKNTNYKMLMTNLAILAAITVISTVLALVGYSIGVVIGGIYLIVIIFYNTLKLL